MARFVLRGYNPVITLVGRWEKGWLDHRVEYFMWKQLAAAYNVDRIAMVGFSDEPRITIDQYGSMGEALASCQGEQVFLEPKGDISLCEFVHPKEAVYIFGNAMNHNLKYAGTTVRIDTPSGTDMFAINAAAIALAARQ